MPHVKYNKIGLSLRIHGNIAFGSYFLRLPRHLYHTVT